MGYKEEFLQLHEQYHAKFMELTNAETGKGLDGPSMGAVRRYKDKLKEDLAALKKKYNITEDGQNG